MRIKYLVTILLFLVCTTNTIAQVVYPFEDVKLDKPADFRSAEPIALTAANFLLNNPFKSKDDNRERAFNFLIRFTGGDKDYNFTLSGAILDLADDKSLMQLFLAAMTKFCLENKTVASNGRLIETSAVKMVLEYCNNPTNNFPLKKKARKRMEAN